MTTPDELLYGTDLFGDPITPTAAGVLNTRFGLPPFTVLDQKGGEWQDRKRAWMRMGIQSEIGRGQDLAFHINKADYDPTASGTVYGRIQAAIPNYYSQWELAKARERRDIPKAEFEADFLVHPESGGIASGTSVFDPVLCEMVYRWFCPPGGTIIDPFAGGSVRGVIAAALGYAYTGVELRGDQVEANREQWADIGPKTGSDTPPTWVNGDASDVIPLAVGDYNLAFSCPPYGNLERYSDDPRDLSTMDYPDFAAAHARIIRDTCEMLVPDSFAVWVVGDYRDKRGHYVGFHADTITAFRAAGLHLYNHAILASPVGSLAMRLTKQFDASRKMGKSHQDVLVFVKGDAKRATRKIAP